MTVRDDGWPSLSSTTRVVIAVADINDHGPEFEQKFYTVQIPASPSTDKPLFQVSHHFPNSHRSIFVIPSLSSWELGAGIAPFSSSSRWNVAGETDGVFRSVPFRSCFSIIPFRFSICLLCTPSRSKNPYPPPSPSILLYILSVKETWKGVFTKLYQKCTYTKRELCVSRKVSWKEAIWSLENWNFEDLKLWWRNFQDSNLFMERNFINR